jgi:hypothetical protein
LIEWRIQQLVQALEGKHAKEQRSRDLSRAGDGDSQWCPAGSGSRLLTLALCALTLAALGWKEAGR